MRRPHPGVAAAALCIIAGAAGCGGSEDQSTVGDATPHATRTTRVQVVEGLGRKGGLDAAALYDRLSPGVVTVISQFGDTAALLGGGGRGEGGQGSGFVLDGRGYVATNAHVVTTGHHPASRKPTRCTSSSPTATGCPGGWRDMT